MRTTFVYRKTAKKIAGDVEDSIDLSGVEFVSRAFADELIHQATKKGFDINISEAEKEVKKMFLIVMESRAKEGVPTETSLINN